ncbi:hypothetical protein UFOVP1124_8 [uncultured Caudovirales phage]|uniref:Uncharacterized protein n=1 Tax=uncultured Caudovirales phage TaxID=2100421 RepID=A0A6J5QIG5_9CAUD|nr:hypothetical protein UFOVP1124_8 [uncultured Caudovirales phage]
MLCDYGDDLTCRACGHIAKRLPTFRECTSTVIYLPRPMLGDALAAALGAVGIGSDRVSRWLGSADCGCDGRRRRLNFWGLMVIDRAERLLNRLSRFSLGG